MPLVKLTIRDEPFDVPEDEVETLRSQGLLEDDPGPADGPPAAPLTPFKPVPPQPAVPPAASEIKKD